MKPTLNKKPKQRHAGQAHPGQARLAHARMEQRGLGQGTGETILEHKQWAKGSQIAHILKQNAPALLVVSILIVCVMTAPTFGVTVETLKQPIKDLKHDIFGGWMWIAKIGAAVGGCVMAVYQRDIIPLATGAAVGLGIHFYDGYFSDVNGALI